MSKPFRYDFGNPATVRAGPAWLTEAPGLDEYPVAEFLAELRTCAARVIAFSQDADLLFVGRSPDSIYDYLSGVLVDSTRATRLSLLNVSMRGYSTALWSKNPEAMTAGREHLRALKLDPVSLIARPHPVALVDLVASGETLGLVTDLLLDWAREIGADQRAIRSKLRFVGITIRRKTSPNTYRWQQRVPWMAQFPTSAVKNVSIPWRLWNLLGNYQEKMGPSNAPDRWADPQLQVPPRTIEERRAVGLAYYLYWAGQTDEERKNFSALLAQESAIQQRWFRSLILELRKTAG